MPEDARLANSQFKRTPFEERKERSEDVRCHCVSVRNMLVASHHRLVPYHIFIEYHYDIVLWLSIL